MREEKEDLKPQGRHSDGLPGSQPAAMAKTQGLQARQSGDREKNTLLSPTAHRSGQLRDQTLVCCEETHLHRG